MDSIEALRRTTRWRVALWGFRIAVVAYWPVFAILTLAWRHVPIAVAIVVFLAGATMFIAVFPTMVAGLLWPVDMHLSIFKTLQAEASRAFFADLFSLHRPPPLAEPSPPPFPWPPPMWHGNIPSPTSISSEGPTGSHGKDEEASGG